MVLAVTDEQGAWSAAVTPGMRTLAVTAPGYLPRYVRTAVSLDHHSDIEITLEPGGTVVSGVVSDIGGGPIANVRIEATRRTGATVYATFAAVSDAAGRYQLSLSPGSYVLETHHDDYVSAVEYVTVRDRDPAAKDFSLTPGGVIRGLVVGAAGAPVPGATVTMWRGDVVVADEDGSFEVRRVPPGINRLQASASRFRAIDWTDVPVALGEQVDGVSLVVMPAFTIEGRTVVKGSPTKPVRDVLVSTDGLDMFTSHTRTRSDAEGNFKLEGVFPGAYFIGAWNGDVSVAMPFGAGSPRVDVVDRDVTGLILELDLGVRVTGVVEPPMEVSIKPTCRVQRVDSDRETGRFELEHMPIGSCVLKAEGDDGWSGEAQVKISEQGAEVVRIGLERAPAIMGRVISSDGTPIAGVSVSATNNDRDAPSAETTRDGSFRLDLAKSPTTRTYRVTAGYRDERTESASTEVTWAGSDVEGLTLTLPARRSRLQGIVVDGSGRPVVDARVSAFREYDLTAKEEYDSPQTATALTADDGSFVLEKLPSARFRVTALASNGTARGEAHGVEIGTQPRIQLSPLGSISGRVTLDGAPVTQYRLSCGGLDTRWITSSDGSYRLMHVKAGSYECTIHAESGTATGRVDAGAGNSVLDFALARRGVITGTFVDIVTGEPAPNVFVVAVEPGVLDRALAGRFAPTDALGRFRIPALAGEHELMTASKDTRFKDFVERPKRVVVRPGELLDLGVVEGIPPRQYGYVGISVKFEAGTLRVVDVKASTSAAAAGIRTGDVITAINGRPTTGLAEVWWNLWGAGQTYRLTLARGVTVTVTASTW